jgi:hypothetical protein
MKGWLRAGKALAALGGAGFTLSPREEEITHG